MADPREIEDGTEIDRDDNAVNTEEMPYDELMKMLAGDDSQPGEDVAFGEGEGDKAASKTADVVSVDDGLDLIDKAAAEKRDDAAVNTSAAEKGDEPEADAAAAKQDEPAPAAPSDLDALLDGLADDRRAAIRERVTAADDVLAIFKGRETELAQHGVKPAEAMKRLIDINAYANRNPSDYVAWAASQLGNPQEVLTKAAERLGFKLVSADATAPAGEDDPFEDPSVKAMREELADYKARERPAVLGPDAAPNRMQADLESFAAQAPHWPLVAPHVAARVQQHVATAKRPATLDDVKAIYDATLKEYGLAAPAAVAPAAQAPQPVAQVAQKTSAAPAASVERAKAASKSLDGSGQGAGRRPALDPDAPLETVLAALWNQQTKA